MGKKYKILKDDFIRTQDGKILYRIKALKDFRDVKAGDLGGYVENKHNLSQKGTCWIYDNSIVANKAKVTKNSVVKDNGTVLENAIITDNASVFSGTVKGNAKVVGDGCVCENSIVSENATIKGGVRGGINGDSIIRGTVTIEKKDMVQNTPKGGITSNSELDNFFSEDASYGYKLWAPKFELTNETINCNGHTLYRIKALFDFGDVKAGDLGGYVESPKNLSYKNNCWIYDNAKVFANARICGDASIRDMAEIHGGTTIGENAKIYDHAIVCLEPMRYAGWRPGYENSCIGGDSIIKGNARCFGYSISFSDVYIDNEKTILRDGADGFWVAPDEKDIQDSINYINKYYPNYKNYNEYKYKFTDECIERAGYTLRRVQALRDFNDVKAGDLGGYISSESSLSHQGNCWIYDNVKVFGDVRITDNAEIKENAYIYGREIDISGNTLITDNVKISGSKINISGGAVLKDSVEIGNDANIKDFVVINGNCKINGVNVYSHKDLNNYLTKNNITSVKENINEKSNEKTNEISTKNLKSNPVKKSYEDIER